MCRSSRCPLPVDDEPRRVGPIRPTSTRRIGMRFHRVIALAAGSLIAADAPQAELDKFQGTWLMVSAERDGRKVPDEEASRTTLVIRGDTFAFTEDQRFGT